MGWVDTRASASDGKGRGEALAGDLNSQRNQAHDSSAMLPNKGRRLSFFFTEQWLNVHEIRANGRRLQSCLPRECDNATPAMAARSA